MTTTTTEQAGDAFWDVITRQLADLQQARGAADVLRILANEANPYHTVLGEPVEQAAPAHFAGSGGEPTVRDALGAAGWHVTWAAASYYYAMAAPDGTAIRYIEGDIYPEGDTQP